jgi:hypothetical protein
MPYKFNESRRHKIRKAKYRVTNWPEYDAALIKRGSLTIWMTEEAIAAWRAPATGKRGGQPIYSTIAIETSLALRLVFHQPLRQTEGLLRSIADALEIEIDIAIPDHTTLSRRGGDLRILPKRIHRTEPLHLLLHKVEPLVSEARGLVAPMHVKDVSLTCPKLCNDNHGRESVSCSR